MDLLKSHKRRSRLSDFAYVILNVAMAVALLIAVRYGQSPWLAIGLVLLSKWRALAVKPRFWFANIVANMVDIIVGISVVVLMYAAAGEWLPQIGLTLAYVAWLLLIKPRSNKKMVTVQAGVSVFMGVTALATVSYSWDSFFFIIFLWLIGYTATRHLLGNYDEPMTLIYSLIVGLIFIEIGWAAYHWMFAYAIPGMGNIKIPQVAIILTLLALIAERAYVSYRKHGTVKKQDILLPILLTVGVVAVLFVFFNRIALNTSL
jgi:hypothetical protein